MKNKSRIGLSLATLSFYVTLSSCGGGGGGDSLPSVAPDPDVASVTPVNLAESVGLNEPLVVKFNQSVANANLIGATVIVNVTSEFGDTITGSIVYDEATLTATFTPDPFNINAPPASNPPAYSIHAKYNVKVKLSDSDDKILVDYQWSFTTRDGVWAASTSLTTPTAPLYSASVSLNQSGQTFASWIRKGGPGTINGGTNNSDFMVSSYNSLLGWDSAAFKIDSGVPGGITDKELYLSDNGSAVAIWVAASAIGMNAAIWSNYYTPRSGWKRDGVGRALGQEISASSINTSFIYDTAAAIDKFGNAIAIWDQTSPRGVFAKYYTADTQSIKPVGWDSPDTKLNTSPNSLARARNAKTSFDGIGDGFTVWNYSVAAANSINSIFALRYNRGDNVNAGSWQNNNGVIEPTILNLETFSGNTLGHATNPDFAINKAGDAIVVFQQLDAAISATTKTDIWAARYDKSLGWSSAIRLESLAGRCSDPKVAISNSGNAIVAWKCLNKIYTNYYTAGQGWQKDGNNNIIATAISAKIITTDGSLNTSYPEVAIDRKGNAFVIWIHNKFGGNTNGGLLRAAHYINGAGWETYANGETYLPLDMDSNNTFNIPQIEVDQNGNATVIVTKLGINRRVGGKIISNRYLYNKGWYMNATTTMGQAKIVEDNVINYELGINGLSNFEIDKLGRIVIISISNSDSNKGNTPVEELTYRLQAYNFN